MASAGVSEFDEQRLAVWEAKLCLALSDPVVPELSDIENGRVGHVGASVLVDEVEKKVEERIKNLRVLCEKQVEMDSTLCERERGLHWIALVACGPSAGSSEHVVPVVQARGGGAALLLHPSLSPVEFCSWGAHYLAHGGLGNRHAEEVPRRHHWALPQRMEVQALDTTRKLWKERTFTDSTVLPLLGIMRLKKGTSVKPYEQLLESNDFEVFCKQLADWVTVGSKLNLAHFLLDAQVYLPSEMLRGVELWDLAGVGDDNAARASMAEEVIHEADFVWVLAKIPRAMSNQMAQKMLRSFVLAQLRLGQ